MSREQLLRTAVEALIASYEKRSEFNDDMADRAIMNQDMRYRFIVKATIQHDLANELRQILLMTAMVDCEVPEWSN